MTTERMTGSMTMDATALDPLHHGAGSVGNVQVLRMQSIILDDGSEARVPFISGNSIKHTLRDGGARFALEALGVDDGSLTKGMIDLLWSGGGLTKGGSAVNLSRARELERLFPMLGVLGYSAGNTMTSSKLSVHHLHLVCLENVWRTPAELASIPHARMLAGEFQGDEFGTRHDAMRGSMPARMLDVETRTLIEGERSRKAGDKGASEKHTQSTQMIYEFETIKPGSRFFGEIEFRDLSTIEVGALQSALGRACVGMHGTAHVFQLGAKSSVGYGRVAVRFGGVLRHIARPATEGVSELVQFGGEHSTDAVREYTEHLRSNRAELLTALREAAE
jgi:hypothetical protein